MISAGNDLIALKTINIARTQQPEFYSKIITPSEKALYNELNAGQIPFQNFIWLLWSVKESVYKYLQRLTPSLLFSPTKIVTEQLFAPILTFAQNSVGTEIESIGFDDAYMYKGHVTFAGQILYFRSAIYTEVIVSVVNADDNFDHTYWGVRLIDNPETNYQSRVVREFVLKRLKTIFPEDDLHISKSSFGYPIVVKNNKPLATPISLSHHDCYIAYSFLM